jgi:GH25 family lysozyme M1 (1,4-beta-N-acetylmuramidase)
MLEPLEDRLLFARAYGIDVSSFQGTINWDSVYSSGKRFVWAKATEGVTFNDANYATYAANAPNGNLIFGAYYFARYDNGNTATAEANHLVSVAGGQIKAGYMRPVVDVEAATTMSVSALSTWVNTFCQTVLNATGVAPIVYTYRSFASAHLNSTVTQWPLWMADYNGADPQTGNPTATAPWSTWNFWQYGSGGTVSGITGNVDVDVAKGDMASYVIPNYVAKSSHFTVGQAVHVGTNAPSGLKAWDTYASNGTFVVEAQGKGGVVKAGPVFIDGFERWGVQYNGDTAIRWSAEDYLTAGAGTAAAPASTATLAPATTTKTASPAIASSTLPGGAHTLLSSGASSLFSSTAILA